VCALRVGVLGMHSGQLFLMLGRLCLELRQQVLLGRVIGGAHRCLDCVGVGTGTGISSGARGQTGGWRFSSSWCFVGCRCVSRLRQ
jgi:hypothetical protein